nr:uncharacterized protein LOC116652346 isoform X1 [Drosophila virilis]
MTQNCAIEKVKLIMQAGTFNTMNDAISKFVNSCMEATGQANSVLYFSQREYGNNRGNREIIIGHKAKIEETLEAVTTRSEATTIMSELLRLTRKTNKTLKICNKKHQAISSARQRTRADTITCGDESGGLRWIRWYS